MSNMDSQCIDMNGVSMPVHRRRFLGHRTGGHDAGRLNAVTGDRCDFGEGVGKRRTEKPKDARD
jgi:hypothetical protein